MKWFVIATGILATILATLFATGAIVADDPSKSQSWALIAAFNAAMAVAMAYRLNRARNRP